MLETSALTLGCQCWNSVSYKSILRNFVAKISNHKREMNFKALKGKIIMFYLEIKDNLKIVIIGLCVVNFAMVQKQHAL